LAVYPGDRQQLGFFMEFKMKNENILGHLVDRLAQIKAQIADLKIDEQSIRKDLVDSGESVVDGMYHRAAITESEGKVTVDWKAIAMHFNPSRQLIKAHSAQGDDFTTVRVSARKTT
jgi:hypothetical protein